MRFRNKRRWRIIRDYCVGWTLAFVFLTIVRGSGTQELGQIQFDFRTSIFISLINGPLFGAISGFAQIIIEERVYRRMSIVKLLLLRLLYAQLFIIGLILVSYTIVTQALGYNIGLMEFAIDEGSFAIYFYILFVDFTLSVLRQVNLMLGDHNLGRLLRGKFYTPHEEERIFMFLDLQSSTELAEKLGHIQYSMFIQDCFNDLGVVTENEAEIYQYVGDEVILTWTIEDGIRNQNCLNAFFRFKGQLFKKQDYYQKRYGVVPFFKAGVHGGVVTVTEVGKYKKEIAYHGDTINTAARIQGQCNALNQELLVSESLKTKIDTNGYTLEKLGSIPLRGKEKEVVVFGVRKV